MPKNFVSNKDETVRMFKNNFFEALSRVHPSVSLVIYTPVIVYLLYLSLFKHQLTILIIIALIILGIFIWTITEYILHRFIFHFYPKSELGEKLHFMFHGVHHNYPNDSRRLVMPPSVSIPLALLFYFLFVQILGDISVFPFFAGFLLGYLFYDITHYAIHHFNMHYKFWLAIKNHHMKYHYQDSNKGFGVSTPFGDIVMRTDFTKKQDK